MRSVLSRKRQSRPFSFCLAHPTLGASRKLQRTLLVNAKRASCALLAAGLLITAGNRSLQAQDKANAPVDKTSSAMEQAIHNYILAHPEVVLESIKQFQVKYKLEQGKKTQDAVALHRSELQSDAASPVLQAAGQLVEPVTVEFFDYRCGYCKKVDSQITGLADKAGVRIVYKHFPILGPESLLAAKAALAASKQNAYHDFHHALITATAPVNEALVEQIATDLKLDRERLKKDMNSAEVSAEIDRTMALATTLGVQSTPTFVIGNSVMNGALTDEALAAAITRARGGKAPATAAAGGL